MSVGGLMVCVRHLGSYQFTSALPYVCVWAQSPDVDVYVYESAQQTAESE